MSRTILKEMLAIPTAPFAEHLVVDYLKRFCVKRAGLKLTEDAAGNVLVHLRKDRRRVARPICLTAHLDHPGFSARKMVRGKQLRAVWRGGVMPEYFKGAKVKFWNEGEWTRGTVRSIRKTKQAGVLKVVDALIDVAQPVAPNSLGMWDFPDHTIRGTRIYARDCDDIAGAAAMVSCIDRLTRGKDTCEGYFLFTRAEEVGFAGALAASKARTIPEKCIVVAMETSSERTFARIGDGPILRVGDKLSVFSPGPTAHCNRIAQQLAKKSKRFTFQRKLMDGGSCESSAYCLHGYDATGICLALGNYHNMDAKRKRLAPEYIDLDDYDNVVKWFVELIRSPVPYRDHDEELRRKLDDINRTYRPLLRASVKSPR